MNGGEGGGQSWTKTVKFGISRFRKNLNFLKILKFTLFLSLNNTSGENIIKIGQYLGELGPKKPPKGIVSWILNWCDKNVKLFNLTTGNSIPIKLTTIMYFHKTFNLAKG